MRLLFLAVLFPASLYSQVGTISILSEQKINDSVMRQTASLIIYNSMGNPICLRVSVSFRSHMLSQDSVELAPIPGAKQYNYDLWGSKEDAESGLNEIPRYPLILFPRSAFVAKIIIYRRISDEKASIQCSYISQPEIDYPELLKKFERHEKWDLDPKIKYHRLNINW